MRTHTYAQTEIHSELEGTEGQLEIERTLRRRRRVRVDMINPKMAGVCGQDGGHGSTSAGGDAHSIAIEPQLPRVGGRRIEYLCYF
jgi:hypothetical protein